MAHVARKVHRTLRRLDMEHGIYSSVHARPCVLELVLTWRRRSSGHQQATSNNHFEQHQLYVTSGAEPAKPWPQDWQLVVDTVVALDLGIESLHNENNAWNLSM